MEEYVHPYNYQQLQNVIRHFHATAGHSLRGPGGFMPLWQTGLENLGKTDSNEDVAEYQRAFKLAYERELKRVSMNVDNYEGSSANRQMPIFSQMDTSYSELSETTLEGETISCFEIGGEKRLCLVQILCTVLRSFSKDEVHKATTDLNINFSSCSQFQLATLKDKRVLPSSAQSCGLITKTDAIRLANRLLRSESDNCFTNLSTNSFKVYHECFGKCKGVFDPELYSNENAACIQCCICRCLFSPQKFVCHSHNSDENRVCHWGFDSANWRSYLLLAKDQEQLQSIVKCLQEMKEKFCNGRRKRKVFPDEPVEKRIKSEESTAATHQPNGRLPSDFSQSPPIVMNPEKIVPFSGHDRYDRDFVPNVCLAPSSAIRKPPKKEYPREPVVKPVEIQPRPSINSQSSFDIDVSSADSDSEDGMDKSSDWRKRTAAEQLRDSSASSSAFPSAVKMESPDDRVRSRLSESCDGEEGAAASSESDVLREGRKREWGLVQKALDGRVGTDKEAKASFIQDYIDSRAVEQRLMHELMDSREELHKNLKDIEELKNDFRKEAKEWRSAYERELSRSDRLEQELKGVQNFYTSRLSEQEEKFSAELDSLRQAAAAREQNENQLRKEIQYLRDELRELHLSQRCAANNNHDTGDRDSGAEAVRVRKTSESTMTSPRCRKGSRSPTRLVST